MSVTTATKPKRLKKIIPYSSDMIITGVSRLPRGQRCRYLHVVNHGDAGFAAIAWYSNANKVHKVKGRHLIDFRS